MKQSVYPNHSIVFHGGHCFAILALHGGETFWPCCIAAVHMYQKNLKNLQLS